IVVSDIRRFIIAQGINKKNRKEVKTRKRAKTFDIPEVRER
ncbi:9405_t:CDS:1, partial [Paraglomus brasilianum]